MIQNEGLTFFDSRALLNRLSAGAKDSGKEVVFVVGAPLTAPTEESGAGVADVQGVIKLIRNVFCSDTEELRLLDQEIAGSANAYQAAFLFLQGRRGQDAANRIVKQAVSRAFHKPDHMDANITCDSTSALSSLEHLIGAWHISPAAQALGELASNSTSPFSKTIITSNFDPLIQIAIERAGGKSWRTVLHADGDFLQSHAVGCQVVHIHGYWHGSDTLHTSLQLLQNRPALTNSLLNYLSNKIIVAIAYGGWEDVLTNALGSLTSNQQGYPEIIWTFFEAVPKLHTHLATTLRPGLDRGRVTLYSGIDCNVVLPRLRDLWPATTAASSTLTQLAGPKNTPVQHSAPRTARPIRPDRNRRTESDRPPGVDVWVGREPELRSLEISKASVILICGIGGQGKSALAARYVQLVENGDTAYRHWDWRDCKEEGDRIRTQLIACIERGLSKEEADIDMGSLADSDLVELFVATAAEQPTVYILDNVDQYVDLQNSRFIGIIDRLVNVFAEARIQSRLILTCRPQVSYENLSIITFSLSGLSPEETSELFAHRVGHGLIPESDILLVHSETEGHPFWLNLVASQVARVPGTTVRKFLDDLRRGRNELPDFLASIWKTLPSRERRLLQGMAETVRAEDEELLYRIVAGDLNYKNFKRALKTLSQLNLIVVKREKNAPDLYDLHPLVRHFVRKNFTRQERVSFINEILKQYTSIIKGLKGALGVNLPFTMLERWSQKAELEIEAGLYEQAFDSLKEVSSSLIGSGNVEEFVRVSRKLFEVIDWSASSTVFKNFDKVIDLYIDCLSNLGQTDDADDLLDRYESTVPLRTARYIGFCQTKAHSFWKRGDYQQAIEWATEGQDLKRNSNVDTDFDCSHTLALAQRDGGDPSGALKYFLQEHTLQELLNALPDPDPDMNATVYGNAGRCYQMLGNDKLALQLLKKSARLLEDFDGEQRLDNQAYAREWIGECLLQEGNSEGASAFFRDAEAILQTIAPSRARHISEKIRGLSGMGQITGLYASRRYTRNWIFGS